MSETADVIIVGGGVMGASIAWHLAQRQAGRIVLLERAALGSGSTGRSVASIDGLTFQSHAVELFARSAAFFRQGDALLDAPCGFVQTGSVVLAGAEQEAGLITAVAHMQTAGVNIQLLTPEELAGLEPNMAFGGVTAASYAPQAGYADPVLTTQAFAGAARRLGVDVQQGRAVTGLRREGRRIVGVDTAVGSIAAPIVIVAAGAWSDPLLRTVAIQLDLQPVRHPVVCLRRPSTFGPAHHSLLDLTLGIYARPETGGLTLLGSLNPQVGYDPINPDGGPGYVPDDYLLWTMERLTQRYPALVRGELLTGWAGIMTISPDWQPVIGGWPDVTGLYCATGFSGQGFQISPAVGDFLAALIAGDRVSQLVPFSPDRLTAGQLLRTKQAAEPYGLLG